MDSAVTGALIGIGVMVCAVCSMVVYERKKAMKDRWKRLWFRRHGEPLLPVRQQKPLLVRSFRRFEMKHILPTK